MCLYLSESICVFDYNGNLLQSIPMKKIDDETQNTSATQQLAVNQINEKIFVYTNDNNAYIGKRELPPIHCNHLFSTLKIKTFKKKKNMSSVKWHTTPRFDCECQ